MDYIRFLLQSKINLELTYTAPAGSGKGGGDDPDADEDEATGEGDLEGDEEGGRSAYSASVSQKISVLYRMFLFNCRSNALSFNCHSNVSLKFVHSNLASFKCVIHSNMSFKCGLARMCWLNDFSQI